MFIVILPLFEVLVLGVLIGHFDVMNSGRTPMKRTLFYLARLTLYNF
jgi:hypothetical protein